MNPTNLFLAVPATLIILGCGTGNAGETINDAGAIVCVNDKWDEKEVEKGHKLVDAVQRCVTIPNDAAAEKVVEDCVGKYEYMPDESWKGSGTCTDTHKGGKLFNSWEEGSHPRSTLTRSLVAPTNTKARAEAARTSMTI